MVDNLNEARSAELAIIISYLNVTVSGFKNAHKISLRILPDFICKKNSSFNFFLINYFEQTCTVTIFGEHGTMAHIP